VKLVAPIIRGWECNCDVEFKACYWREGCDLEEMYPGPDVTSRLLSEPGSNPGGYLGNAWLWVGMDWNDGVIYAGYWYGSCGIGALG